MAPRLEALEPRLALTAFTLTSPTSGGALPAGVTAVGGVVLDLIGVNGQRVVSQVSAGALFKGFFAGGDPAEYRGDPGTLGVQQGFTPGLLSLLGGGLAEVAVRLTVFDGDTGLGNFDRGDNVLLLNGVVLGNFSDVVTEETTADGETALSSNPAGGFRDSVLDTGFFYSKDPTFLDQFFASLAATGEVRAQLQDVDPFDNFFDFTQGLSGSLAEQGFTPTALQAPSPEPPPVSEPPRPAAVAPAAELPPPAEVSRPVVLGPPADLQASLILSPPGGRPTGPGAVPLPAPEAPRADGAAVVQVASAAATRLGATPLSAISAISMTDTAEPEAPAARPPVALARLGPALATQLAEGAAASAEWVAASAAGVSDEVFANFEALVARWRPAPGQARRASAPPSPAPEAGAEPAPTAPAQTPARRGGAVAAALAVVALLLQRGWWGSRATPAPWFRRRQGGKKRGRN